MESFVEVVIFPAVLPWLIVMVTGWVEDRLDSRQDTAKGIVRLPDELAPTRKSCMVLDFPAQPPRATAWYRQD